MRGSRHAFACGLAGALLLACGGKEAQQQPAAPTAQQANHPPEPPSAVTARFDAAGQLHLAWRSGSDPDSKPSALRVEILLSGSPYGALKESGSRLVTAAGALTATLDSKLADPLISLRTMDPQGLTSTTVTPATVEQAAAWTRWPSGEPDLRLNDCGWFGERGLLCVGEGGAIARLRDGQWTTEASNLRGSLRLATSPVAPPWLRTTEGRILRADDKGSWLPLAASLAEPYPAGPLRDLQGDAFGLTHLIDATGAVWLGDAAHLLRMTSPLALEEGCDRLRAVGFSAQAGLAICETGHVYSVANDRAGMQWLPLTGTTDPLPEAGLIQVIAASPSEVIVVEPTRIRRVAVGGWTTLLDKATTGSETALQIGRAVALASAPNTLYFPTSAGLAKLTDGSVAIIGGTPLHLVGALPDQPAAGQFTLVDRDGTRFVWNGSDLRNLSTPPLRADLLFHAAADLLVAVTALPAQPSDPPSLLRMQRPSGVSVTLRDGLRMTDGTFLIAGSEAGLATVWMGKGGNWQPTRLDAEGLRPTEILAVDEATDGSLIAISEHEVFRRVEGKWSHHGSQPASLRQVFAAGTGFLLFAEGTTLRCDAVACQPAAGDLATPTTTAWREGGGRWSLAPDGALRMLVTATSEPAWKQVALPLSANCATGLAQRIAGEGFDLLRYSDGRLASATATGCEPAGTAAASARLLQLAGTRLVAGPDGLRALSSPKSATAP